MLFSEKRQQQKKKENKTKIASVRHLSDVIDVGCVPWEIRDVYVFTCNIVQWKWWKCGCDMCAMGIFILKDHGKMNLSNKAWNIGG